mmetsp:Transcript_11682/g.18329  ORF Transcript_11682/g.18329 Transcript_11682/m.18329 type:complete len:145 (+) Transcript_11682:228-662(+)|eukprot:CAMPEP_0184297694 /NCGR_PEP_ID=MMETSP1049-20130417/8587_1 /TAXON_ID=77928 /ORGANISM="Proteomonas sulcata, Strain CCMP704" /LENGTH=144 /DNA_ID=CAMNT_0026607535 /DNA_START=183 /DNA_END=617 /DNA_ORIENTATION=+
MDMQAELLQLQRDKEALTRALTQKHSEIDSVKKNRIEVVEKRTRRLLQMVDEAVKHNGELEKEYDKLNAHAKQLTSTVQKVVQERKALEAEISAREKAAMFQGVNLDGKRKSSGAGSSVQAENRRSSDPLKPPGSNGINSNLLC